MVKNPEMEGEAKRYLQSNGIDYCHNMSWREVKEQLDSTNIVETPETITSFKERIDSLSKEAREVVEIILNTPQELLDALFMIKNNKKGRLSKNQLTQYLRYYGWKLIVIDNVFGELEKKF